MLIIDGTNILFIEFSILMSKIRQEGRVLENKDVDFLWHLLVTKLHSYIVSHKEIFWVWDSPTGSKWRKSIYPEYKGQRKSNDDIKLMFNKINEIKELFSYYPIYQLEHPLAEGDDLIYSICKKFKNENKTIYSSDGDLAQIAQKVENVTLFNPIKKVEIKIPDYDIVLYKSCIGDSSDNIPGLYRVGPKSVMKYLTGEKEFNFRQKESLKLYKQLIDFDEFPYQQELSEYLEKSEKNIFNPNLIELFFFEHDLRFASSKFNDIKFSLLNESNDKS